MTNEITNTSYIYKNGTVFAASNTVVTLVETPAIIRFPPCAPCFPFSVNTRCAKVNSLCDLFNCIFRCFR